MSAGDGDDGGGWLNSRWVKIAAGALGAVVVAGVALWWFVFRDDAPAAVDLDTAVGQVDGAGGGDHPVEIAGAWTVDTTTGEFDFEQATGSFAGFRVNEELTLGTATAVGRTGNVAGSIDLTDSQLSSAAIEVDLSTITTDRSQRDSRVRSALDTNEFPLGTFSLTQPVELPAGASEGAAFAVDAVGELTLKGVTNTVTFALDAQLVGETVVVVGSTEIQFDDFGIQAPSAPVVVSVEDHGIVEFQLLFTK